MKITEDCCENWNSTYKSTSEIIFVSTNNIHVRSAIAKYFVNLWMPGRESGTILIENRTFGSTNRPLHCYQLPGVYLWRAPSQAYDQDCLHEWSMEKGLLWFGLTYHDTLYTLLSLFTINVTAGYVAILPNKVHRMFQTFYFPGCCAIDQGDRVKCYTVLVQSWFDKVSLFPWPLQSPNLNTIIQ